MDTHSQVHTAQNPENHTDIFTAIRKSVVNRRSYISNEMTCKALYYNVAFVDVFLKHILD